MLWHDFTMIANTIFKMILLIFFAGLGVASLFTSNGDICELGGGYEYDAEHDHILGPVDIPPFVIKYNYNKSYIIVQQDPPGRNPDAIYDKIDYKYPAGNDKVYYWIIDKTNNSYYGPVLYADFLKKCREKKINLTFD